MRRTKAAAAETAQQILDSAESLFLEKGYDNVRLEEIATAAGVTRGAVHWHFINKQGLLLALSEKVREPFRQLAENLTENADSTSLLTLASVIGEAFERIEADPRQKGLLRVMFLLDITMADPNGENQPGFREEMRAILTRIFRSVERGAGFPAPWCAETAAAALSATLSGLVGEWTLGKGSFNLIPEGHSFVQMILTSWVKQ